MTESELQFHVSMFHVNDIIHLMIVVYCFQYQNKTLVFQNGAFLTAECRPRCEIRRNFQQFLRIVRHVMLMVNDKLISLEFYNIV